MKYSFALLCVHLRAFLKIRAALTNNNVFSMDYFITDRKGRDICNSVLRVGGKVPTPI